MLTPRTGANAIAATAANAAEIAHTTDDVRNTGIPTRRALSGFAAAGAHHQPGARAGEEHRQRQHQRPGSR